MRAKVLIVLVAVQACAPPAWTPAKRLTATSCLAPDTSNSAPWQLVPGAGFTFCVPGDWESQDGRTWRATGAVMGWCTKDSVFLCPDVRIPITDQFWGGYHRERPSGQLEGRALAETIGGVDARLARVSYAGRYATAAMWPTLKLLMVGRSEGSSAAALELEIYRSVRFAASGTH